MNPTSHDLRTVSEQLLDGELPKAGLCHTEIRVKGKAASVPSVSVEGRNVITNTRWLKVASIHDEELIEGDAFADPVSFLSQLKQTGLYADLFTFVQKLPDVAPRYGYHREWDNLAVIPISTFSDWWEKRADAGARRAVRKAAKSGVVIKLAEFDDAFVEGIVNINNETPIRQGKPFWHFRKSFDAVKLENSTYVERNDFLGAYDQGELVGYIRLTYVGKVANILQLLTMVKYFDKRLANALIAKAVEICEQKGMSHLTYCNYIYNDPKSSLTEFKRRNGFEQVLLPRYYIPLTTKGKIALSLGIHQGLVKRIPQPLLMRLLKMRNLWYARRLKTVVETV